VHRRIDNASENAGVEWPSGNSCDKPAEFFGLIKTALEAPMPRKRNWNYNFSRKGSSAESGLDCISKPSTYEGLPLQLQNAG
jgi:hypothetical protein